MPQLIPSERIGTTVTSRYTLHAIIGKGASAVVFAGLDRSLDRDVAVKVMRPDGALAGVAERERFRREALTLARLRHPNLVEVYDVGETDDGVPFVVMELLRGESLAERIERTPYVETVETLAIVLPLMGALARVHEMGVIHRDIKPANVFLSTERQGVVPKLLDFGIAKSHAEQSITGSGLALGTPAYMAPEQARGEPLGAEADVWAVGVMLYRMLSGRLPFDATTAAGVLWQATQGGAASLASLASHAPHLDRGLAVCVERALMPSLARRHPNMLAFAESLTRTARRAGFTLPPASQLAGLPHYGLWCDATDAEVRTAPHVAAAPMPELRATSHGDDSTPTLAPEPTEATQSQASVARRPVGWRALAAVTLLAAVMLGGLAASTKPRTPARAPGHTGPTTSEPLRVPAAVAPAASVVSAVPSALDARPLAPGLTDGGVSAAAPHENLVSRTPKREKRKTRAKSAGSEPKVPEPKPPATAPSAVVTDFEW